MECPNCRASIMDGSTLCVKCGANLKVVDTPEEINPEVLTTPLDNSQEVVEETTPVEERIDEPKIEETTPVESTVEDSKIEEATPVESTIEDSKIEENTPVESTIEDSKIEENTTVEEQHSEAQNEVQEDVTKEEVTPVEEPTTSYRPAEEVTTSYKPAEPKVKDPKNKEPKSNNSLKTILFVVIGIILICAAGFGISKILPKKTNNDTKTDNKVEANPDSLILIKRDSKYGYIDTEGNVVVDFEYDSATEFYGNYAMLSRQEEVEENGYKRKARVYYIIDTKGTVKNKSVLPSYSTTYNKYFEDEGRWVYDGKIYDSNFKQLSPNDAYVILSSSYATSIDYLPYYDEKNNKFGIINSEGKITFQTTGESVSGKSYRLSYTKKDSNFKNRYCSLTVEYKTSTIVNCDTGKVVLDFIDHEISTVSSNIFYYSERQEGTYNYAYSYMFVDNDKIIYQIEPAIGASMYYYDGYLSVKENKSADRYYYIISKQEKTTKIPTKEELGLDDKTNVDTSIIDKTEIKDEWEQLTGYTKFTCTSGYGLIQGDKVKLPCEYYKINYLPVSMYKTLKAKGKEYVIVAKDDIWHVLNLKDGKVVYDMSRYYPSLNDDNVLLTYKDETTGKKIVLNILTGKVFEIEEDVTITIYSNYFTARYKDRKEYYNNNFKLIYTE